MSILQQSGAVNEHVETESLVLYHCMTNNLIAKQYLQVVGRVSTLSQGGEKYDWREES